jgi:hypothetical protein
MLFIRQTYKAAKMTAVRTAGFQPAPFLLRSTGEPCLLS